MPGKRRRPSPLSAEDIAAVMSMWRRGARQVDIAVKFQITQARVSQIVNAASGTSASQ